VFVCLFGLTIVASISGKSPIKGLLMAILGILFSLIGMDPITNLPRLDFGIFVLHSGINLIAFIVGLFAISEVLIQVEHISNTLLEKLEIDKSKATLKDISENIKTLLRSSFIGTLIGAIPGAGSAIASFVSYDYAKRTSKNPKDFGKGSIEGLCSSEAANNAITGGALIPLLTLGIPGDTTTAVLMGVFIINGLFPGAELFIEHRELINSIYLTLLVSNIFMLVIGFISSRWLAFMVKVPKNYLNPVVLVLCLAGIYSLNSSMIDVFVMTIFGLFGYILRKKEFPIPPMVLGFVLGNMVEYYFRQSLIISTSGSILIFFTKPISLLFIILSIFIVGKSILLKIKK